MPASKKRLHLQQLLKHLAWKHNSCWLDCVVVSLLFSRNNPVFRFLQRDNPRIGTVINRLIAHEQEEVHLMQDLEHFNKFAKTQMKRGDLGEAFSFLEILLGHQGNFQEFCFHAVADSIQEIREYQQSLPTQFFVIQNFTPKHATEEHMFIIANGIHLDGKKYTFHAGYIHRNNHWTCLVNIRGKHLIEVDIKHKSKKAFQLTPQTNINTAIFIREQPNHPTREGPQRAERKKASSP